MTGWGGLTPRTGPAILAAALSAHGFQSKSRSFIVRSTPAAECGWLLQANRSFVNGIGVNAAGRDP